MLNAPKNGLLQRREETPVPGHLCDLMTIFSHLERNIVTNKISGFCTITMTIQDDRYTLRLFTLIYDHPMACHAHSSSACTIFLIDIPTTAVPLSSKPAVYSMPLISWARIPNQLRKYPGDISGLSNGQGANQRWTVVQTSISFDH